MWKKVFKIFLLLYIPLVGLTFVLIHLQKKGQLIGFEQVEKRGAEYKKNYLSDLCYSLVYNTQYWCSINYPVDFDPLGTHSEFIKPFLQTITGISDYDQFRFLDMQGKEFFRYERENREIMIFGELQDKATRDYVQKGLALKRGEIYLSPINLNKENGVYEKPYKPVIRGVGPIFNSLGDQIGIVVINFKMARIFKLLKSRITDSDFYLVDSNLNIVTSNVRSLDLGYEIPEILDTLNEDYKLDIPELKLHKDTTFLKNGSMWTSQRLNLSNILETQIADYSKSFQVHTPTDWAIVQEISAKTLRNEFGLLYRNFAIFNFFGIIASLLIAYGYVRSKTRRQQFYLQLNDKNKSLLEGKKQLELNNIQISEINERLQIRNKQLEEFNYVVSHNLRGPVTSMAVIVDMIKKEHEPEKIKILIPKLDQISKSISNLTEDIKEYITILDQNEILIESINLHDVIESIKNEFLETLLDGENFKVIYDLKDWDTLDFSKFYLKSIIQNFISNSIKYRRNDVESHIIFESRFEEGRKVLYVKDNGIGINMEHHSQNVFKLYKRFHRNISGKGMGLFLIKSQLEALNAKISVKSIEGEGTSFKIKF
tara:strand:+ start:13672 stop:15465 length:1794 start_codon:yes stop_codon:yes gene_type:complete